MELRGIEYLRKKLKNKEQRVRTRYKYYEMKNGINDQSKMIPPSMKWMTATLGWCSKAVDSLADRLCVRGFDDDDCDIGEIYRQNNADVLFDSAILSALVASCCFIYISADDGGYPRLQVIDGGNATGVIDPITGLLYEGYAVLERDSNGVPSLEAYFEPGRTTYYEKGGEPYDVENAAPWPLLVPIIYRPDAVRPFGHSRISRACMQISQSALRTILRSEVSAEFYAYPQKYILGLSQDAEPMESWKATMSTMLAFTKDDDGDKPVAGQFQQASMSPYTEQLRTFAALFAGETGLTLDDLGFVTDNPSSADAIRSSHENLRLAARKAQRTFGTGFINAGYLAACVRDNFGYQRTAIADTRVMWEPVFEPDATMLAGIGDAVGKINEAVPGFFDAQALRDLTGMGNG